VRVDYTHVPRYIQTCDMNCGSALNPIGVRSWCNWRAAVDSKTNQKRKRESWKVDRSNLPPPRGGLLFCYVSISKRREDEDPPSNYQPEGLFWNRNMLEKDAPLRGGGGGSWNWIVFGYSLVKSLHKFVDQSRLYLVLRESHWLGLESIVLRIGAIEIEVFQLTWNKNIWIFAKWFVSLNSCNLAAFLTTGWFQDMETTEMAQPACFKAHTDEASPQPASVGCFLLFLVSINH